MIIQNWSKILTIINIIIDITKWKSELRNFYSSVVMVINFSGMY